MKPVLQSTAQNYAWKSPALFFFCFNGPLTPKEADPDPLSDATEDKHGQEKYLPDPAASFIPRRPVAKLYYT